MSPKEKMTLALMGLAGLFIIVAILVLLSKLTTERLGALSGLRGVLATYPTYVIGAIGVANEVYASFRYDTPFNWTGILTLLGVTAATGAVRSGQKETAATAKGIEQTTDVILNTMPIGARKGAEPPPVATPKPTVTPGSVL